VPAPNTTTQTPIIANFMTHLVSISVLAEFAS
jgi:hypothetical protein